VLSQTYTNLELIIVNDNTTDHSHEYLMTLTDCRTTIYNVDFSNASKSRNYGFQKSSGEFIQYLDADDILDFNKIEIQLNSLIGNILGLSVCRTMAISENGELLQEIDTEFLNQSNPFKFIRSLYSNPYHGMVQPNAWFFSRELHELAGSWNQNLTLDDDGEFFCRVILKADRIVFCDEILNYYRKFQKINQSLSLMRNYTSWESAYLSANLKVDHLINCGQFNKEQMDKINASFFSVIASDAYLINSEVYKKSMKKTNLSGYFHEPYTAGFSYFLSCLIGWRAVKLIKFLKNKIQFKQ
jgi:glycosyltransferase involved in cell wall biosynthesis